MANLEIQTSTFIFKNKCRMKYLVYSLGIFLLLSCNNNIQKNTIETYDYLKLGNLKIMKENLKVRTNNLETFCYNDSLKNCDVNGTIINWRNKDTICPKGWHLPNTIEMVEIIKNLPGEFNTNNGKLMSKKNADNLYIKYAGSLTKKNDVNTYFGKDHQEIWLVNSDSIWSDPINSGKKFYLMALHIYQKNKDSITIEPTFSGTKDNFYGYCRCIKD